MNLKKSTDVLGLNVPNIVLYGAIAVVLLVVTGVFKGIKNFFSALMSKMGLSTEPDMTVENAKEISLKIESNSGVKSQLTSGNNDKAEALYKAMNGAGTDEKAIFEIFKSITGPNQMGAVFKFYGTRTLNLFSWWSLGPAYPVAIGSNLLGGFTGNLSQCLENELGSDFTKNIGTTAVPWSVKSKLKWLNDLTK